MKTFTDIDFRIQICSFIFLLFVFFLSSLISGDFIDLFKAFIWISIVQLMSMLIRLVLKCEKGIFFYFYFLFSTLFWMYVLYEKSRFKFSYSLESIWILLSVYSGYVYYFFSIFYLFYSYETFRKLKTKL